MPANAPNRKKSSKNTATSPTGPRLLFVDDEEVIRKSFTRELQAERFTLTTVDSGAAAMEALEHSRFDLVITDLMMPGIDGFGVLKAVKQLAPFTSVIILTGYGDMRAAIDALRLGADDFTIKPCDIDELVFRINRCLEKRKLLVTLAQQKHRLEEERDLRQAVEAQLLENEKRFRLALDASSNGVWDRNLVTGEVYYGENWWHTLGQDISYSPSSSQLLEDLLHPEDRERFLALQEEHLKGSNPHYEAEFRIQSRDGAWRWILSRGQTVARDAQGQPVRIIGTFTDITRLKDAEAALLGIQTELEERVRQRTVELSESNVALTVLLRKREEDRSLLAEQVLSNASQLVDPFLDRLTASGLNTEQQVLVDILRANIKELTSPFAHNFSTKLARLTPGELQVANLVQLGKRTKEIAAILHLSPGTISIYRKNIRKKLDLTHQKTNLQTTLSISR